MTSPGSDDDLNAPSSKAAETSQSTHGVHIRWTQWAALGAGVVLQDVLLLRSPDGVVDESTERNTRYFLVLEVPAVGASLEFISGGDITEAESTFLNLRRLRLGSWPVEVRAQVAYLENEQRYYALMGADWVYDKTKADHPLERKNSVPYWRQILGAHRHCALQLAYGRQSGRGGHARVWAVSSATRPSARVRALQRLHAGPELWA